MAPRRRLEPLARAVLRSQPDDRLVALAREGREAAFEEIVRRYRPGLVAFAAAFAPQERAEDVVQESLVRSWSALRETESEIQLRPWLYTIVRNRALNARRDLRPHEPLDESVDGVPQPADIVLGNEELARVVAAVGTLPDAQREALVRSSLEGHTHEQIAESLGTSTGGVRQLVFRARATLRHAVGVALPLPLVRALSEAGGADAATAAAGGGALAAGSLGAGGGTSVAAKVIAIGAIGAVAAGSGVAIKRATDGNPARGAEVHRASADGNRDHGAAGGSAGGSSGRSAPGSEEGPGSPGEDRRDDDSGDRGPGRDERGEDSSGEGDGGDDDFGDGDGDGDTGSSGPGGGNVESGGSGGSGSGGSGSSGSGSGSSGSGESGDDGDTVDSSGPGSGSLDDDGDSSHSGPGGSGSGSGSGDAIDDGLEEPDDDSSGSGSGSGDEPDDAATD